MKIFTTATLPSIAYVAALSQELQVIIEVKETWKKQSLRNRFEIQTAQGTVGLTIPVKKPNGSKSTTDQIVIDYSTDWQQKWWRTIASSYNKSAFFLYYKDGFQQHFFHQPTLLIEYNEALLTFILDKLSIDVKRSYSTSYLHASEDDYRSLSEIKNNKVDTAHWPYYFQVFNDRLKFAPNLSILDLLFNIGPEAKQYLTGVKPKINKESK